MNHAKTQYFVTLEKWEKPLYDYADIVNFVDYINHAEENFSPLTLQKMIEIDLWIETTDVNWDTFTKNHIRDLHHFVKTYSALWMPQWFDSETTEANRVIWFRDCLEEYLSCLQSFDEIDLSLWNKRVDFDVWYMSTYKKLSNDLVERDIEIRSLCASIRDDEHLPRAEKYDKIEKLVQHYYYHATDFTTKQIKRLQDLKIHERREKLSSWKKIVLLAWITTLLLLSQPRQNNEKWIYTTPITPEQLFKNTENNEMINDYISDQLVQEEQTNQQDEMEQWWSKNKETYDINGISQTLKKSQVISDTMNAQAPSLSEKVVKAVREVFSAPAPLETMKVRELKSDQKINTREMVMEKITIGGFDLYKDPIADVYFRKVKKWETIGAIHRALQQDKLFLYLKQKKYTPHEHWDVHGRNIPADELKVWKLIPIPIDLEKTTMTKEECEKQAYLAIQELLNNTHYAKRMKTVIDKVWEKQVIKVLTTFALKESHWWWTAWYRFEDDETESIGAWHVVTSKWPWKIALDNLQYTKWMVIWTPYRWLALTLWYVFEKVIDCQYSKKFKKYYKNPYLLFKKSNLEFFAKSYNWSQSYSDDFIEKYDDMY